MNLYLGSYIRYLCPNSRQLCPYIKQLCSYIRQINGSIHQTNVFRHKAKCPCVILLYSDLIQLCSNSRQVCPYIGQLCSYIRKNVLKHKTIVHTSDNDVYTLNNIMLDRPANCYRVCARLSSKSVK